MGRTDRRGWRALAFLAAGVFAFLAASGCGEVKVGDDAGTGGATTDGGGGRSDAGGPPDAGQGDEDGGTMSDAADGDAGPDAAPACGGPGQACCSTSIDCEGGEFLECTDGKTCQECGAQSATCCETAPFCQGLGSSCTIGICTL